MKHFRAVYSFGVSFGMDLAARSKAYQLLKKSTKPKDITGHHGIRVNVLVAPYMCVAGIMREAGWIVSERQSFAKFQLDDEEEIYIEYPDGIHI